MRPFAVSPFLSFHRRRLTPMLPDLLSAEDVLALLRSHLTRFFEETCPNQHGFEVPLQCDHSRAASTCRLQFDVTPSCRPQARIRVRHVGGNMYDVYASMGSATPLQLAQSIPAGASADSLPVLRLGEKVGAFILVELERIVGRHMLREHRSIPLSSLLPSPDRASRDSAPRATQGRPKPVLS